MPDTIRLIFSKTGRARFISHLDLMAVFQRAFYRAELPLRYSQGFNPHAYISISLPLSVSQSGLCERLDVGVESSVDLDALPSHLNLLLPEGVTVLSAALNGRPVKDVVWARYDLHVYTEADPEVFLAMFSAPLIVDKRTKKGSSPTDLLPMIRSYACARVDDDTIHATLELAAQNPTLNPSYIVAELERRLGRTVPAEITRVAFLDGSGADF